MSTGATQKFHMPRGWTLRRVVTTLVQEWLPPFRAEPAQKGARWVVQSVMEEAEKGGAPLWEPGISTAEYEERLDRTVRSWAIRATAGRGKGTVLARFAIAPEQPGLLEFTGSPTPMPETLFDAGKVGELLQGQEPAGGEDIFTALLAQHGFKPAEDSAM